MVDIKGPENFNRATPHSVPSQAPTTSTNPQLVAGQGGTSLPLPIHASPEAAAIPSASQPSREQIESSVVKIADYVQSIQRNLSFSLDESTGYTVLIVTDSETDEVIRQLPSDEVLKLAQKLNELREMQDKQANDSKGNLLKVLV